MSTFDREFDKILGEAYFGGSPYERVSGIKRHVTFEARRPGDVNRSRKFDAHDDTYFSPEVAKFVDIYKKYYRPEDSGGAAITTASTGPGSDIRNTFINLFGDVEMYLQDVPGMILYTVPDRDGKSEMYDDPSQPKVKGMNLRAHHDLLESDDVRMDSKGLHINPGMNSQGATYGAVKTVSELLEENAFTLEVDIKRVDHNIEPNFDTFYPADLYN